MPLVGPVFVTKRSDDALTVVDSLAELLAGVGSDVGLDTNTLFVIEPPSDGAVTITVILLADAPDASEAALVHVSTPPTGPVHTHPVPVAETNVTPVGSVSATVIVPAASLGPAFETVRV